MKKINVFILLLILYYNNCYLVAQDNEWKLSEYSELKGRIWKIDDKIKYFVDSATSIDQRNTIVKKTKQYLAENLKLLNKSTLDDSIYLVVVRDGKTIEYLRHSWLSTPKGNQNMSINLLICIYSDKLDAIQPGLMDMILKIKWGEQNSSLNWLHKGLVYISNPQEDNSQGYTLENKYTFLLQNYKLLPNNQLLEETEIDSNLIPFANSQSAYITKYILEKYGIEKIKTLLTEGMSQFKKIYGLSFSNIILTINQNLNNKHTKSINLNKDIFYRECFIKSILADWHPFYWNDKIVMMRKIDNNIEYIVPYTKFLNVGDNIVNKTKQYLTNNLALVNEHEFTEPIRVIVMEDRDALETILGVRIGGLFRFEADIDYMHSSTENQNTIYAIYDENKNHNTLKHELMHAITMLKWGKLEKGNQLDWLIEGIATFADSSTYNCDGLTLEERYIFLLYEGKILESEDLMTYPDILDSVKLRIAYNQSAYIVEYLLRNYGAEKIKLLWSSGMDNFEEIYKVSFEKIILEIASSLYTKFPKQNTTFTWEKFNKDCIN
ncbi:hypothetical protein JGH11_14690 [Dysgonomonas sp. Marseille-P4677]|uniref:hypothetical protein n=1 Tax=Dysgonomonas sp. Marseille-P4677 TaxID=2364790 RepID=UPI001913720C|nr:hypothetical protein [Dysgonomonas sp. Marseille-P4677]MBK5722122.1 hypothetical protein [Dysgonomonas sp. Marseille-P4677]